MPNVSQCCGQIDDSWAVSISKIPKGDSKKISA